MKNHTVRWVLLSSLVLACQSPKERIGTTTVQHIRIELSPDAQPEFRPTYVPEDLAEVAKEMANDFRPCPKGSILIEGDYCPRLSVTCQTWVSRKGEAIPEAKPADGESGRCGTFKFPTVCLEKKVHVRYCIDKYELPNVEGQPPQSWMSFYDVKNECEARGERICEKSEWTFACEGEEMRPLPYGDGYHRDSDACNLDKAIPAGIHNTLTVKGPTSSEGILLDSLRAPAGSMPWCVSPFGVYDMVGNIDEFVHYPEGHVGTGDPSDRGPYTSELVGGHYFGVRNACRPMTPHDEHFKMWETGGRCCSDPKF